MNQHYRKFFFGLAMEGVFAIHKPYGKSSAQVLRDLQEHFDPSVHFSPLIQAQKQKRIGENYSERRRRRGHKKDVHVKIGHGGTLDPAATGVLVCGIGSGTKSLGEFLGCTKQYDAVVLFGAATDSYDGEGKLVGRTPTAHITRDLVEKSLNRFRGKFMQRPPIFSALNVEGKRLYEYAREGKEVPGGIEERPVEVESVEITEWFDGGQHSFRYPKDASRQEKRVAERLLKATGGPDLNAPGMKRRHEGADRDESTVKFARTTAGGESAATKSSNADGPVADSDSIQLNLDAGADATATADSGSRKPEEVAEATSAQPEPAHPESDTVDTVDTAAEAGATTEITGTELEDSAEETSGQGQHWTIGTAADGRSAPAVRLRIVSSRGFYVRSLCHDLGLAVDSTAFMASLVRTRQGDFELGRNVFEYSELDKGEEVWAPQISEMLDQWTKSRAEKSK